MAEPNLTESAWQRAKDDAAGVYRTTTFQLGGALLTAIFSSLALIAQEGQPTTTQVAVAVLAAAVAILLSVVVVLVCQLAAAPVRQRNELREAWEAPEIEIVNVDLTLRNAHRRGNELAHLLEQRLAARQGTGAGHREEAEAWTEEVVGLLAKHAPGPVGQQFIAAGSNEQRIATRLRLRVTTFQQIIDGLEVDKGLE